MKLEKQMIVQFIHIYYKYYKKALDTSMKIIYNVVDISSLLPFFRKASEFDVILAETSAFLQKHNDFTVRGGIKCLFRLRSGAITPVLRVLK